MAHNFTSRIAFDGKTILAIIVPQARQDGMYYEINVKGYDRFYMKWSALDRYDIASNEPQKIPYNLILAVSDAIEKHEN